MDPISIAPLQPTQPIASPTTLQANSLKGGPVEIMKVLTRIGSDVSKTQKVADEQVAALASGKTDNIHQVMLSLGKAEVSFNYMMEVRNRLMDAYNEIMRMGG